ncbi:MAG: hypothetical protein GY861_15620 [bacterium]|nr:hypothetical protein [bacterium]
MLIVTMLLASCTPQYHINKAKKHTNKAIKKGATFTETSDTIQTNTVVDSNYIQNDTVYIEITKVIEKVITKEGEVRYITRKDKRREYRKQKTEDKRDYKLELQDKKTAKHIAKADNKLWNKLIIIVILLGIILIYLYEKTRQKN